ncbi:MAG TPA: trypsin-like peptidase domain-containing protein [Vicinamibacterales bacterium]|nr:trypsin-like peptidase domain-containing protein [Vicinamibacterales bacterium]
MRYPRGVFKRISLALILLTAGLVAGIVLTGRMQTDEVAVAQPGGPREAATDEAQRAVGVATGPGPDFTRVAEQTIRAVANISSVQVVRQRASPFFYDPFFEQFFGDSGFGARERYASSLGSGVVVSADGYVVTNNHVLGESPIDKVTVSFADRRELSARIVGVDTWTDLALLKVDASNLPLIAWGNSSELRIAEWVMAIGNPYQLNQSVSLGIVSALGRSGMGITAYEDFIQTDAAINPGNSGGALVNGRGELVGINTAIFTQSGGYQGIGFAVPSNLVRRIVDELRQYGEVRRGSIGYLEVAPLTTGIAEQLGARSTDGVVVMGMRQGPAARAGIEPYDIILAVDGQRVTDTSSLLKLISDAPIGGAVTIEVLREGQRRTFKVPVEQQGRRPVLRGRGRQ